MDGDPGSTEHTIKSSSVQRSLILGKTKSGAPSTFSEDW